MEMNEYDYFVQDLVEILAEDSYDDNYQTYDYEYMNGMHQRFTLPNGMRITF